MVIEDVSARQSYAHHIMKHSCLDYNKACFTLSVNVGVIFSWQTWTEQKEQALLDTVNHGAGTHHFRLTALSFCTAEYQGASQGVVNRDIKLENTLLDGSKRPLLKICDFGYSKNDKDSVPKSKVGTPGYTGKESIRSKLVYVINECNCRRQLLVCRRLSKIQLAV